MGGSLNIPEEEKPNIDEVELLSKEDFFELAYQLWWKLGACASDLCFFRVGKIIGRSSTSLRYHYNRLAWKDRREEDKKTDKEHPGGWLKGRVLCRVEKKDTYLLEHEREASSQVPNKDSENSILEIDPYVEEINAAVAVADPRTKEGALAILSGMLQTGKVALMEGRVNLEKPIDFDRILRLQGDIASGRTQGSGSINITINTAVPRPPDKPVLTIEAGEEKIIDAEYAEVKEAEDVGSS